MNTKKDDSHGAVAGKVDCRVRLCRDCAHSMPEPNSEWNMRCMHPLVNARDPWALAGTKPHGSDARDERGRTWTLRGLAPCGMRGGLWEPTEDDGDITGKTGLRNYDAAKAETLAVAA